MSTYQPIKRGTAIYKRSDLTYLNAASAAFPKPNKVWLVTAVPWLALFATFAIFFLMDQKMDAPLTTLDDVVISDVAQQVSDGDVLHKFLTVGLAGIGCYMWFKNRRRARVNPAMAVLFGTYLSWVVMGAMTADDPALTVRRLGGYVLMLLMCVGCSLRMDVDTNSFFLASIPALTILPDIVAELKSHGFQAMTPDGRFGGTYPHPNVAAAALAVPVIVFLWFAFRVRGLARNLYLGVAVVAGGLFMLTRSRTSMVGVIAALVFSLAIFVIRRERANLARLVSICVLAGGLIGLTGLIANSTEGGVSVLNALRSSRDEGDPTTLTGRVDLWKTVLQYANDRPLMGYGFGGFWSAKRIEDISAEQQWPINQSHNAYIDQVLSLGYPGALLYCMILLGSLGMCTARYFQYQDGYGVWGAILVFVLFNGFAEAISLPPGYLSFVLSVTTVQLVIVKGNATKTGANGFRQRELATQMNTPDREAAMDTLRHAFKLKQGNRL